MHLMIYGMSWVRCVLRCPTPASRCRPAPVLVQLVGISDRVNAVNVNVIKEWHKSRGTPRKKVALREHSICIHFGNHLHIDAIGERTERAL